MARLKNTTVGEINTVAGEVNAAAAAAAASVITAQAAIASAVTSTSTTSLAPATGSKAFTTQSGKLYTTGMYVLAVSAANASNWMYGQVASYSGTTLTLTVSDASGSTAADWNLSVSGIKGAAGSVTLTGTETLANKSLTLLKTVGFATPQALATTTGAVTVDWANNQNAVQAEPTGPITYTFNAPAGPCHLQLLVASDGTSTAQTITWPAAVKWLGYTWAAVANKNSIINIWWDGTYDWATGTNQV